MFSEYHYFELVVDNGLDASYWLPTVPSSHTVSVHNGTVYCGMAGLRVSVQYLYDGKIYSNNVCICGGEHKTRERDLRADMHIILYS